MFIINAHFHLQIGVSFVRSNVSLWCVDIKKLKPWGGAEARKECGRLGLVKLVC